MNIFVSNMEAIGQIFIIGILGFWILHKGIMGECCLHMLTRFVLSISLPCLIFSNIVRYLTRSQLIDFWFLPFLWVALFLVGFFISYVYTKIDKKITQRGEFIDLVSFTNVSFLPVPLISTIFTGDKAAYLLNIVFIFNLFFGILYFTLGMRLLRPAGSEKLHWREMLNNSFIATVIAIIIAGVGLGGFVPEVILRPMEMVGKTTIPLVMIVLGGIVLVNWRAKAEFVWSFIFKVSFIKLIIMPLIMVGIVTLFLRFPPEISFVLLLQAAMPAASSLALLVRSVQGNERLVSQSIFIMYILSIVTVPLFVTLARAICNL